VIFSLFCHNTIYRKGIYGGPPMESPIAVHFAHKTQSPGGGHPRLPSRASKLPLYVFSFRLPSNFQRGFFTLVNSILQVYFTNTPGMKVYVKSYGGWMMSAVAISQAQSLKTSLDNVQATHETEYYYNVGYNSPMKIMNRHNEAWYIVEGEPVCPKME
uniref:Heme-binding protein soul5 n=1 Tax=Cyprinus carpio carpio TaxID=630221 RepID=A0A9J8D1N9_CYPCA